MSKVSPPLNDNEKSLNELPKARFWEAIDIYQWEGYWLSNGLIKPAMKFKSDFIAQNDDVLLASTIKTGTTWLKSLTFYIMQKNKNDDVLANENPHFQIPTIETMIYTAKALEIDPYNSSSPRLLHTHLPYTVLPDSVKISRSKIIYIARNPKDTIISMWHYFNSFLLPNLDPFPLEKAVDCFCNGVHLYGPFFEHVLEYWKESKKRPEKILFLKYEDLKRDPKGEVSKIGEFLGKPFGGDEEIQEVLEKCSLNRLRNLEVNKNGSVFENVPNSSYFRKGIVGDWRNYLTFEMAERIDETSRAKFEPFGLFF